MRRWAPTCLLVAGFATAALLGRPPAPALAQAGSCATTHWVGAWTADPSGTVGTGSANQTLRIIVSPHVGGTQVRVHLSNRYGSAPVTFARAQVALRQAGPALVDGSSQALTFGGRAAVSVAPGTDVTSDPVALTFGAFQDLAVSLYMSAATGPATGHLVGRERSYTTIQGTGDHTGDAQPAAFVGQTTSVDYVDAIDALVPPQVGALVVVGDSITDGYEAAGVSGVEDAAGIDAAQRFPDYLARRLLAQPGGPSVSVLNAGISGNRVGTDEVATMLGPSAASRLGSDVLGVAGVTDAIVLEGLNDIFAGATAEQVEAALAQVVARLHAGGLRVLLGTLTPAGAGLLNLGSVLPGVFIDSPPNVTRVAVNAWIRSGASGADGFVDFDAALRGQAIVDELDPAYDSGDHLHPNASGYSKLAGAVNLTGIRGTGCGSSASSRRTSTLHVHARSASAGHLSLTGSLLGAGPGGCAGTQVVVRSLVGGRTLFKRHLAVTAACRFAATTTVPRGRLEIRASFTGSPSLTPARARAVYVRIA